MKPDLNWVIPTGAKRALCIHSSKGSVRRVHFPFLDLPNVETHRFNGNRQSIDQFQGKSRQPLLQVGLNLIGDLDW